MRSDYIAPPNGEARALFEAIFSSYQPLAWQTAQRAAAKLASSVEAADLGQEASLSLARAIARFDPARGRPFRNFATKCIYGDVARAANRLDAVVRLPAAAAQERRQHEQDRRWSGGEEEQPMSTVPKVMPPRTCATHVLDRADEGRCQPDALKVVMQHELRRVIELQLRSLTSIEERVLRMRYGLAGVEEISLRKIGSSLGLLSERVAQIEKKALRKLGGPGASRALRHHV